MSDVADTIARALQDSEGQHDGIRRYELMSRLSGHTVPQLRDALTVEQLAAARHEAGHALSKGDLIAVIVKHTMKPTLASTLRSLLASDSRRHAEINGLHLTVFPHKVVNIDRRTGDLERADVDATRAAFAELGYEELEAWLPRQGVSLLSGGVSAGVSFRIRKQS